MNVVTANRSNNIFFLFYYIQEEKQRSAFEMLQFQTDSRLNRIKKEVNRPMISNIRNGINNCLIYRKKS